MPRDELRRYAFVYYTMGNFMPIYPPLTRLQVAAAIVQRAPDRALTTRDLDLLAASSEA